MNKIFNQIFKGEKQINSIKEKNKKKIINNSPTSIQSPYYLKE